MRRWTWIVSVPILVSGCNNPQLPPITKKSETMTIGPIVPSVASLEEIQADIKKSGQEFVRALRAGNASADMLTKEFRVAIAPPDAVFEADVARGYSALRLKNKFEEWDKLSDILTVDCPCGTTNLGYVLTSGTRGQFWIKFLRVENLWLVDAVHFRVNGSPVEGTMTPQHANAWFAALVFIDGLTTKNYALAAGSLSTTGKGSIAPPIFESDKAKGYSEEKLKDNLAKVIPADVKITNLTATADGATGDITVNGVKKTLVLKLSNGRRLGEMFVDRVEIQ